MPKRPTSWFLRRCLRRFRFLLLLSQRKRRRLLGCRWTPNLWPNLPNYEILVEFRRINILIQRRIWSSVSWLERRKGIKWRSIFRCWMRMDNDSNNHYVNLREAVHEPENWVWPATKRGHGYLANIAIVVWFRCQLAQVHQIILRASHICLHIRSHHRPFWVFRAERPRDSFPNRVWLFARRK